MKRRAQAHEPREGSREAQKTALLDVAGRILVEEGEAALSVRKLARAYGASTMVVYSLFDGKDGVVDALLTEGFRRFVAALAQVNEPDPWMNLRAMALRYRRFALDNPTYYQLMWSRRCFDGSGGPGRDDARANGAAAFACLARAVGRVLAELDGPAREIEALAVAVWSHVHGAVSLELLGIHQGDEKASEAAFERAMNVSAAGLHALHARKS